MRDRVPDPTRLGCECAYETPPPWTQFQAVEHHWHHLLWEHNRRRINGEPTLLTECQEFTRAQSEYLSMVLAERDQLRTRLTDLTHADEDAELDAALRRHPSVSADQGQGR
jgi:hypothetical protein